MTDFFEKPVNFQSPCLNLSVAAVVWQFNLRPPALDEFGLLYHSTSVSSAAPQI
jgi:hypothetical protein